MGADREEPTGTAGYHAPANGAPAHATVVLLAGRLQLRVPPGGPGPTSDSLLLARFAATRRRQRCVIDLGAGSGVVGLAVAVLGSATRVHLVERHGELARAAAQARADTTASVSVHQAALPPLPALLRRQADLVVCNPPYHRRGHRPAQASRQLARHGDVQAFLAAAAEALASSRARACFCFPAARLQELLLGAAAEGLHGKRMQLVRARAQAPARLVLLELARGQPGGLHVEPDRFEADQQPDRFEADEQPAGEPDATSQPAAPAPGGRPRPGEPPAPLSGAGPASGPAGSPPPHVR